MARSTPAPLIQDEEFIAVIAEWNSVKQDLTALQTKERELRDDIYYRIMATHRPDGDIVPGTYNLGLPNDWKISAVSAMSYKVDEAALDGVRDDLPEGTLDRVLKYKPELSKSNYNKLDSHVREIFDHALIIKPSAPQLKLIAPPPPKTS